MALLFGEEVLCREKAAATRRVNSDIWCQYCGLLELSPESSSSVSHQNTSQCTKRKKKNSLVVVLSLGPV